MMVLLQSLPAAAAALTSSGATLSALLRCYGGAVVAMSCSDWDLHSRLMAMQQHVALAIAALCPVSAQILATAVIRRSLSMGTGR